VAIGEPFPGPKTAAFLHNESARYVPVDVVPVPVPNSTLETSARARPVPDGQMSHGSNWERVGSGIPARRPTPLVRCPARSDWSTYRLGIELTRP